MKKILYIISLAAAVLTGCKGQNEAEQPIVDDEGQEITLSFAMDNNLEERAAGASGSPARRLPGDPGKDDFIAPTHLYFIVWAQSLDGSTNYMRAVRVTDLTWEHVGVGIYNLTDKKFKFKLPKSASGVQQLMNDAFYVYGFASTADLLNASYQLGGITFDEYTEKDGEGQELSSTGAVAKDVLDGLTYALPAGVSTQDAKRDFFRSIYSTALSETSHNQMATSPTIRLRHTAARLDINWECDETVHPKGLTPNSTWTLATAYYPTAFSLFTPGSNATGTQSWSETITIDEGNRYNGRYVTYLPMPTTPTFTVTSDNDTDKLDGENYSKSLPLAAGTDVNFATWMRALWTIK